MSTSISRVERLVRLFSADASNVSRDPMLLVATLMSLLTPICLWLARDYIDGAAEAAWDIKALSNFIVPVALLIPAVLIGWVSGFLLLEDRDDGLLLAIDVTPFGKIGILGYRLTIAALLTALVTAVATALLLPASGLLIQLSVIALVALSASSVAVALLALARNKVEGLAIAKLLNLVSLAPLAAAIPSQLRLLFGIVPTYWLGEMLDVPSQKFASVEVAVAIGAATNALLLATLLFLVLRRAG